MVLTPCKTESELKLDSTDRYNAVMNGIRSHLPHGGDYNVIFHLLRFHIDRHSMMLAACTTLGEVRILSDAGMTRIYTNCP
jgi:hypothetical protein